jgi:hypothetical protein
VCQNVKVLLRTNVDPRAKAAYQDFLTLWKDADPDIPVLQQPKSGVCGVAAIENIPSLDIWTLSLAPEKILTGFNW